MPGPDNPFLLKHLRFCLVLWLLACQVALSAQTLASRPILLAHGFCGSALDFQPLTGPLYQQLPSDLYPSSTVYYVFYDSIRQHQEHNHYFADLHRPNLGRINLKKAGEMKSGKTQGSIAATFEWTDMEGNNPILTESRVMTFYSDPKLRYFDVDITLTAIATVTFGDGKDGAF